MPRSVQQALPPMGLPNREHRESVLPKQEQQPQAVAMEADALAAQLFDEALTNAKMSTAEAAYVLKVSESLVRKMRNPNERESPSSVQLLKLGPAFLIEWHHAMDRRFGFGRAALGRLLEAAGTMALGLRA